MKTIKKRRRISGKWAGLCSTYIAKLMGRSLQYTRKLLYTYGKAKSNSLTVTDLGWLIWRERTTLRMTELRKGEKVTDIWANGFDSSKLY